MLTVTRIISVRANEVTKRCLLVHIPTSTVVGRFSGTLPTGTEFLDRNEKLRRPLSPHLSIYQKQLPMMLSGTHRVTGALMAIGLGLVGGSILLAPEDFTHYVEVIRSWHLNPYFIYCCKFGASFFLAYHYINGIRHLAWDMGKGFQLPVVYKSGYLVLGVVLASAAFLATR